MSNDAMMIAKDGSHRSHRDLWVCYLTQGEGEMNTFMIEIKSDN